MYNYQVSLNNAYQKQAKLFEQADGSSLHRASDNPMNYYKLLRYNISETENTQYRDNIKTASNWMKNSDSVMVHMTGMMQTMKEKSVEAANSPNSEDDYAAIYKEMNACMQELVAVANTQVGDRYLFSGQKDLVKPFEMSTQTYERGLAKNLDTAQATFFKGSNADYNTELFQMLELEMDGETYYLDTESGNLFTKDFVDNGYKKLVAQGYSTLEKAGDLGEENIVSTADSNFKVSDYFTNQGLLRDENENYINIGGYMYNFKTIKQNIVTYKGDENLISMVKLNGATDPTSDTVNSTGGRMFGRDIFDNEASGNEPSGTAMLNNLFCVCAKVEGCDTAWMSSDGVTVADVAHATLIVEETRVGSRQQLYQSVESMLEVQGDNITEDITNVSGTDIAQLATQLMQMTTLYNLSLSMGGRILPQSLADYL
ncbi:MAG: flagellar hook-associated protein 3 [Selenomonadaceae bacterium]|nr:flagellar hook-associated protein 3 [Selenomonadaceae bacterium]